MSYVTDFYKAKEHNYKEFFSNFEGNKAIAEAKAELKTLAKKLEEKNVAYTKLLNKRYNSSFEPTEQDTIFQYTNRNGSTFYFDASTGLSTSDIDNTNEITLDTKSGEVSYVAGYCLKDGAVLVKNYKYSIPSDNSKINLKLLSEVLVPMFSDTAFISELNTTSFSEVEEKEYSNRIVNHALGFISATEFISKFYGMNKKFNFSLGAMKTYTKYNKSFEIIIRTCEDSEIMSLLLNKTIDKAVPIHEVIGTTKECLKYAESLGLANKFIRLKNRFATESFYSSNDFKTILNKTDKEWIDFIEKVKHWEEDLTFYTISYRGDLLGTLVKGYIGGEYPFYYKGLNKAYPFSKYCSYVVEESINQGYTSIETFIKTLSDYISMCNDLEVTPTLYSSYLHQTHDIVARNHKIKLREEQEEIFAQRYSNFKPFVSENYTVVAPVNSQDLQKEGDTLNHCVASYIKRVVDNECLILFLRKMNEPEEPLVTLEIRNNSVVQARGLHNRPITANEKAALFEFAKAKGCAIRV